MAEPDPPATDRQPAQPGATVTPPPVPAWVASLPPPPFVDQSAPASAPRFAPLSPRVAVLIGAAIVIGLLLWMARDSVRPFVVGLLLVYLLDPPVRWLVRRGVRRSIAIAIVYIVAIVGFLEFLNLTLTPLVNELLRFIADFPRLAEQLQAQLERLSEIYARLQIPDAVREWIDAVIAGLSEGGAAPELDLSFLMPLVTGAGSIIGAIFGYVILPVWVFYLLKDRATLTGQFDAALPQAWRFDVWAVLRIVQRVFGQWVRGQIILGITVGVFTFIGLTILSIVVDPVFGRYAILLSVIAGILELVPIIGPIIAAVPAVLLAATAGLEAVVAALVLYTLVQQVENNFLVPKIQGDAVELHSSAVIFAIIIGGALAGLLGAILALPIAAAIRDVVRYLFRRLSPDAPEALAASVTGLGLEERLALDAMTPWRRGWSPPMTAAPDPYKILQVDPEAEDEVIVAAYRRLARKYHPDVAAGPEAAARMSAINAAWEVIGEPARRAAYDRERAVAAALSRRGDTTHPEGLDGGVDGDRARELRRRVRGPAREADRPGRPSPRPCRAIGRAAVRRSGAATTSRCGPRRAPVRPAPRPASHRGASSTSVATRRGRSARSAGRTSSTSSGSIGCRSAGRTATRSTRSCVAPGVAAPPRPRRDRRGLFRRR